MAGRARNRERVVNAIQRLLEGGDTEHWVERLARHGIVVAGVQTLDRALDGDIARDRAMVAVVPTADGPLRLVGNPIHIHDHQPEYRPPPLLGEHDAVLLEATRRPPAAAIRRSLPATDP